MAIQLKRGNLAGLPTGLDGEPLFTLDVNRLYIGDSSVNKLLGVLENVGASAAPGSGDDAADGYSPGSRWIDTTADKVYICVDSSVGAAVWKEVNGGGSASFPNQSANLVFAGPTSGGAAAPTFRALVDDDIPDDITIDGGGF